MRIVWTKTEARRFLLHHQGLLPPRQLESIDSAFHQLHLIQHDPLNPCGRNVDLVLQSRLTSYHVGDFSDWLYGQRKGVELFDKVMCLAPVADFKFHGFGHTLSADRSQFVREFRTELDQLLERIRVDGPVSSVDLLDERKFPIGWNQSHWGAVALETLWRTGEVVIAGRKSGRRYYDLSERVIGQTSARPTMAEHVLRRIGCVGLLPINGAGTGWLGAGSSRDLRPVIAELIASDQLAELEVGSIKNRYVALRSDIDSWRDDSFEPEMVFIAPLDNLIWDRQMMRDLFEFDYLWEVYTPASRRKFGYYVLPILYGDRLVGRIEPVAKKGVLSIKGLWWESTVDSTSMRKILIKTVALALERFTKYAGCQEIIWS